MPNFKITLAYDGTDFVGWQRQASGVSVQGLLEDILREFDGGAVPVAGAGRTDAGVHALAQVAAFSLKRDVGSEVVIRALNAGLPESVRVLAAEAVADTFHPRFDARAKRYRYRIWNAPVLSPFERRYAWHIFDTLDVDAMQAAARVLEGRHDFAAFQASGSATKTTVRDISSSRVLKSTTTVDTDTNGTHSSESAVTSVGVRHARDLRGSALVFYDIVGDGFLRHMVRTIVGTLVEIGRTMCRRKPSPTMS